MIYHSRPRCTKDLDIWIHPNPENARKLMHAFRAFGIALIDIEQGDFEVEGTQYVIGVPPVAVDFLTSLGALRFPEAWRNRRSDDIEGTTIHYLGKQDLISAKEMAGRPEDLSDIRNLRMSD